VEHAKALEDQDVGLADHLVPVGQDVVGQVGIDRRPDGRAARLHVPQEPDQAPEVVALREAFPLHQPAGVQDPVGEEEAVGRDQVDPRMVRPAGQKHLKEPREGALADRHAAGHADDVRDLRGLPAKEVAGRGVEPLDRGDVHAEQAGEREVDLLDFAERYRVVHPAEPLHLRLRERQGRLVAPAPPLGAAQFDERGGLGQVRGHDPDGVGRRL